MASKAKIVDRTDPTQPERPVEETEGLLHSTREQEIGNRAYEIYMQRGGQPGHELEDWLRAERELTNQIHLQCSAIPLWRSAFSIPREKRV